MTDAPPRRPRGRPRAPDDERRRPSTISTTNALWRLVEAAAAEDGVSVSAWVEGAIKTRLKRRRAS